MNNTKLFPVFFFFLGSIFSLAAMSWDKLEKSPYNKVEFLHENAKKIWVNHAGTRIVIRSEGLMGWDEETEEYFETKRELLIACLSDEELIWKRIVIPQELLNSQSLKITFPTDDLIFGYFRTKTCSISDRTVTNAFIIDSTNLDSIDELEAIEFELPDHLNLQQVCAPFENRFNIIYKTTEERFNDRMTQVIKYQIGETGLIEELITKQLGGPYCMCEQISDTDFLVGQASGFLSTTYFICSNLFDEVFFTNISESWGLNDCRVILSENKKYIAFYNTCIEGSSSQCLMLYMYNAETKDYRKALYKIDEYSCIENCTISNRGDIIVNLKRLVEHQTFHIYFYHMPANAYYSKEDWSVYETSKYKTPKMKGDIKAILPENSNEFVIISRQKSVNPYFSFGQQWNLFVVDRKSHNIRCLGKLHDDLEGNFVVLPNLDILAQQPHSYSQSLLYRLSIEEEAEEEISNNNN